MKRLISVILILISVFLLVGCKDYVNKKDTVAVNTSNYDLIIGKWITERWQEEYKYSYNEYWIFYSDGTWSEYYEILPGEIHGVSYGNYKLITINKNENLYTLKITNYSISEWGKANVTFAYPDDKEFSYRITLTDSKLTILYMDSNKVFEKVK